jgi:hypothetical protein
MKIQCECGKPMEDTGKESGLCYGNPLYGDFKIFVCNSCRSQALYYKLRDDEHYDLESFKGNLEDSG